MDASVRDPRMRPSHTAGRQRPGTRAALVLTVAAAACGLLVAQAMRSRNPLRRAWRAAAVAERYQVRGETRWGSGAQQEQWQVVGSGRLDGRLALTLTQASGAPASPPLDLSIAWPELNLTGPLASGGTLEPHALARALAVGDPLVLLATGQGGRSGPMERVGIRDCRVWDFQVGGGAYLSWWRAHPRFLPANADSGGLPTLEAQARLWQDPSSGLPCRLAAQMRLPRVAGEETGQAWLDWTYDWPPDGKTSPAP